MVNQMTTDAQKFEHLKSRTNLAIIVGNFKYIFNIVMVESEMLIRLNAGYRINNNHVINYVLILEKSNSVIASPFHLIRNPDNPNLGILYSRKLGRRVTLEELNLWIESNID